MFCIFGLAIFRFEITVAAKNVMSKEAAFSYQDAPFLSSYSLFRCQFFGLDLGVCRQLKEYYL